MHFSAYTKFATALLLLMVGWITSAHAQNNKPIRSGTWYEDQASANLSPATSVTLTFAQTPTDKFLNVTNVSCLVQINSELALRTFTLFVGTTSGSTDLGRGYNIRPTTGDAVGTLKVYSIATNGVFFKMGPGRYPTIIANTDVVTSSGTTPHVIVSCTMVGNLTDD